MAGRGGGKEKLPGVEGRRVERRTYLRWRGGGGEEENCPEVAGWGCGGTEEQN